MTPMTAWVIPPPRVIGTVLPAAKNLCTSAFLAQISDVHMVQRIPPCSDSVAKYLHGMSHDRRPGSSNVLAWLLTVINPFGRWRCVTWWRKVS